jgi:putative addiction module CopG family antidote
MPTRHVNLTQELDSFVEAHVQSGQYANASEVFRAGLRALGERERLHEARVARLRSALEEGERGGIAEDDSLEGLLAEFDAETG